MQEENMSGVKIATVATSISALSISGVKIKDTDKIPEEVSSRLCPILFPDPDEFVTNFRIEPQSLGAGIIRKIDVLYTLNYVYLHTPIGSDRYIAKHISAMINKYALIMNTIIANDAITGSVDIMPKAPGQFGRQLDASGNLFWGFMLQLDVLEFYEVEI